MYYNNITNRNTTYPYRFKTVQEFENEYGEDWYDEILFGWSYDISDGPTMNYLFGKDFEYSDNKNEILTNFENSTTGEEKYVLIPNNNDTWTISLEMLTENKKIIPTYNTKRNLIYESKKSDEYDKIIYKCNSDNEIILVQELAFKNGYTWMNSKTNMMDYDIDFCNYIIFHNNKHIITRLESYNTQQDAIDLYTSQNTKTLYIDEFSELKLLFRDNIPTYNTKRNLIYENNIIKYNEFIKNNY